MSWRDDWPIVAVTLLILLALAALVWISIESEREWQRFSAEHNCRKVSVERQATHVGTAVNASNGQVSVVVLDQGDRVGYLCDDGVTYYRSR